MPIYDSDITNLNYCINSILNQIYDNIELIIIMDKSKSIKDDQIISLIKKFNSNKIILHINKSNLGIINSLNMGIRLSKGKFIARMDDDDISNPHRLIRQINFMKKNNLDFCGTWAKAINTENQFLFFIKTPIGRNKIRNNMLFHNPFLHPTMMFKRDILKKINYYKSNAVYSEDYDLYMRLIVIKAKGDNLPQYLVSLRDNPKSITRGKTMIQARMGYIKQKFIGVLKYHFRTPLDIFYFLISPIIILVPPKFNLTLRRLSQGMFIQATENKNIQE
jgi:glycosyltransferase involved in cell wall biosynthesis